MSKKFSLILIVSALAGAAHADTQRDNYDTSAGSLEETTGFFSGIALGAATGGPPGAIVGAAIGAFIGNGWKTKGQFVDIQADLFESRRELTALQEEFGSIQREHLLAKHELERLKVKDPSVMPAFLSTHPINACCDNTVLSIHFRTGSSKIESHYEEQLESLVNIANQMPDARVEITGYADRIGNTEKNLALSRHRNESVTQFFRNNGIESSTITTIAYGEARPLQINQNFETDFFDRRVMVKLRDNRQQLLTQTPDND